MSRAESPIAVMLRLYRASACLTQFELAERIGISQPVLCKMERSGRAPGPRHSAKLLLWAFDTTPSKISVNMAVEAALAAAETGAGK